MSTPDRYIVLKSSEFSKTLSEEQWRYKHYLATFDDGREEAVKVDRKYATGFLMRQVFGEGVVECVEIDEAECLRRWETT
jgi:hypothetical protein|tara:strand:+ start:251 stop:490 length:240 start_codon:yes stop_codon:yes gene_type:complete